MSRRILIAPALALLTACASNQPRPAPDNAIEPRFTVPPSGALILVLPPMSSTDLDVGARQMTAALDASLRGAGYRVAWLAAARFEQMWAAQTKAAGGLFDADTGAKRPQVQASAVSSIAATVCAEVQCDLVLMPRLVQRMAKLDNVRAEWDGVFRPLAIKGGHWLDYQLKGSTAALSLAMYAITPQGQPAYQMHGGITLLHETNVKERRIEARKNLFESEEDMQEAVRTVLSPLGIRSR